MSGKRKEGGGKHGTIRYHRGFNDRLPGTDGKPVDWASMERFRAALGSALKKKPRTKEGQYYLEEPAPED